MRIDYLALRTEGRQPLASERQVGSTHDQRDPANRRRMRLLLLVPESASFGSSWIENSSFGVRPLPLGIDSSKGL